MVSPPRIVCVLLIAAGSSLLRAAVPTSVEALPAGPRRVLVIDSYHPGFPWSERLEAALRAGLSAVGAEIYTESLDAKRFPAKAQEALLADVITRKYAGMRFQAVVAADDNAYQFLLRCGDDLCAGVPVVFCGVNDFVFDQLKGHPNVTGVVQATDVYDTLAMAHRFMPQAERVVFIHDDTPTGHGYRACFERDFVRFTEDHPGIGVRFLSGGDLSTQELLREAAEFRPTDLVLLSRWFVDKTGQFIAEETFVPRLSSRSPVPVWGLVGIGTGTVGGRLVTPESQGAAAARLVARILGGAAPWSMPVQVSGVNQYTFDWQQLRRWGFSARRLPSGSVLVNEPDSLLHAHRYLAWSGGGLLAVAAVFVPLLATAAVRRRRAEARQRDTERRLKLVTEGVSLGVFDWCTSSSHVVLNRPLADMIGLDPTAADAQNPRRILRALEHQDRHVLLRRVSRCLHS